MRTGRLVALVSLVVVTAVAAPVTAHDGEHHDGGKEETGWPGSARGQQVARAFLNDSQPAQDLAAQSSVGCVDGTAAGYGCKNVSLESFLPLEDIGGGKGNDVWGWTDPATGTEYALMGRTTGTSFVDISQPANPVYLGDLPTTRFASTWRDIKVYRNFAFIVSESRNHGMQVFDLTSLRGVTAPTTFSATALYTGFSTAHNVFINEDTGFAYAIGTNTCSGGLHIVDISTPTSPAQAGCYGGDGYSHDVQCVISTRPSHAGREICFASNEDTLTVVDVTNKSKPIQLARLPYAGAAYTHQGWLTGDQSHFLIDDELDEGKGYNTRTYVFDVSNPAAPVHVGTHVGTNPAIDHNQYVVGNHTYQANYRSGLRILDITGVATATLEEVAYFDIYPTDDNPDFNGAWSVYPFFKSGNVLVSGIEQGLFVLRPTLASGDAAPSVKLTEPTDGSTVAGTVSLLATATDDKGVASVEFVLDSSTSLGVDTTGSDGWTASWDSTKVPDGSHTLTAVATDTANQTARHSVTVTVRNTTVADPKTHVADLVGSSQSGAKNTWTATVVITVADSNDAPVADATVFGSWSAGTPADVSCATDGSGQCSVTSGPLLKRQGSVTFEVTRIDHATMQYDPTANVVSSIVVSKP